MLFSGFFLLTTSEALSDIIPPASLYISDPIEPAPRKPTPVEPVPPPPKLENMTFQGYGLYQIVRLHAAGTLFDGENVNVGQCIISYKSNEYTAYSVDIDHKVGSGEVTELDINTLKNGDMAAFLFEIYASGVDTEAEAAALGVAIWEVTNETESTFDVTDGFFKISDNPVVTEAANALLDSLPKTYQSQDHLTVLHSDYVQDMMISSERSVPEPAALSLLFLGGLGMLFCRRACY